jgi:Holliday junction DNA helicase RuvB
VYYTENEVAEVLARSAKILGIEAEPKAVQEIAKRSRATPRTANYLLKRARDFAQVQGGSIDEKTVRQALALLEVDELGLTNTDRDILNVIIDTFKGGPVGLNTIAAALSEEAATVEEVHEPYLMQIGLLERTPRGRAATKKAYTHLGYDIPKENDTLL